MKGSSTWISQSYVKINLTIDNQSSSNAGLVVCKHCIKACIYLSILVYMKHGNDLWNYRLFALFKQNCSQILWNVCCYSIHHFKELRGSTLSSNSILRKSWNGKKLFLPSVRLTKTITSRDFNEALMNKSVAVLRGQR